MAIGRKGPTELSCTGFGVRCAVSVGGEISARVSDSQSSMASTAPLKSDASAHLGHLPPEHVYFGPSGVMQTVRQKVERAAGLNVPILILGESGTGK